MLLDGNGMVRGVHMLEDPELMQNILTDTGNLLREQGTGRPG